MKMFVKRFWSVVIGLASIVLIIVGLCQHNIDNLYFEIGLAVFSGWLISFLIDILPSAIKEKRALQFVLPKVEEICYQIDQIDAILCFYVGIDNSVDLEDKIQKIIHIISLNNKYRVNILREDKYLHEIRENTEISVKILSRCENNIKENLARIEKFWSYLPLDLCRNLAIIDESASIYSQCTYINYDKVGLKAIDESFKNHSLAEAYRNLMQARQSLIKYKIRCKRYKITLDNRSSEEIQQMISRLLNNDTRDK